MADREHDLTIHNARLWAALATRGPGHPAPDLPGDRETDTTTDGNGMVIACAPGGLTPVWPMGGRI